MKVLSAISILVFVGSTFAQQKDQKIVFPVDNDATGDITTRYSSPNRTYDSPVTGFAWTLFQGSKLANPAGNLVLSPLILQLLLAIIESGAAGETKTQLRQVIGVQDARSLQRFLSTSSRTIQLESAAGIFADLSHRLDPKYANYVRSVGAEIVQLDFKNNPENARKTINDWAAAATHRTIQDVISSAVDVQSLEIIITSAIYFHSSWKYTFNGTNPEIFYTYVGRGSPVEFMETKQNFVLERVDLGRGVEGEVIEIPYESEEYSMLLVLPDENVTLDDFIRNMNYSTFDRLITDLPNKLPRPVILRMPKFRIKSHFSVLNVLLKMGIVNLFTLNSRLPQIDTSGSSKISDIVQDAALIVDEKGTTASAVATSFLIPLSAVLRKDIIFNVNKPFLSIIVDKKHKIPIFISKIYQPTL